MDYISSKLATHAGDAISEIKVPSKKKAESQIVNRQSEQQTNSDVETKFINVTPSNVNTRSDYKTKQSQSSLARGIPFGGGPINNLNYSQASVPPPIGFRTDLIPNQPQSSNYTDHTSTISSSDQVPQKQVPNSTDPHESEDLSGGSGWARLWFQRHMLLTLTRLLLFVCKLYEDFQATKTYNLAGQTGHFLLSAAALFLPTVVFTIYRVARYLQLALPPLRLDNQRKLSHIGKTGNQPQRHIDTSAHLEGSKPDDEDAQVTRALMSSPGASSGQQLVESGSPTTQLGDDDGLVTARQSPSNLEDFQDSIIHQETEIKASNSAQSRLESIDDDILNDLPDKETARLVMGAAEQFLHGFLFVFWQLKRQVDVMSYLVERACVWRKPKKSEQRELAQMGTNSDGLEWFQDFYAAFLAILVQVYTLVVHWSRDTINVKNKTASVVATNEAIANTLESSPSAELLHNFLGHPELLLRGSLAEKDLIIYSQLIVSSALVVSLLLAVRRLDDGPLTLFFSMLGWGSLFASRIIILGMAFVYIGLYIMLPLVIIHVFGVTAWIYKIAIDSHNDRPSEILMEAVWDDETAAELESSENKRGPDLDNSDKKSKDQADSTLVESTSQWSVLEHLVLLTQIFYLFAVVSIFYWPIMFNMKFHLRPLKYLSLILMQNFILIPVIWSLLQHPTPGQLYLLAMVGAFSITGFIFVSLYYAMKPRLTEYFAMANELFNASEKSGIYFEFCSRVFKMPDLSKNSFQRLMRQPVVTEEVLNESVESNPSNKEERNTQRSN